MGGLVSARRLAPALLLAAVVAGTAIDGVPSRAAIALGGHQVIAADFHVHSSTWSDATVSPFGLVLEAQRQGLDAMAITGHNQTLDARWGRWFSERIGGPTVLVGAEIPEIRHHLIAVGIEEAPDGRLPIADQIADVHRQGGIAIAAHPVPMFWDGFEPVMDRLDGAEVCHPAIYELDQVQDELAEFAKRASAAAIGSSDFHGPGRLGVCRTFVFARDNSAAAILEAIRAKRTVVYGRDGEAYGDPELIRLAAADGRLPAAARPDYSPGPLDRLSQVCGLAGLAWLLVRSRRA
jgi:predicted metal-dependent phosphoesterase TrpH